MEKLDLNRIVAEKELNVNELAVELFPSNKFPKASLTRILNGESELTSSQISKLSTLVGLDYNQLFSSQGWSQTETGDIIKFTKKNFVASLNVKTWITQIHFKNSLIHQTLVSKAESIVLSDFIKTLDKIVDEYQEKIGEK